MKHWLTISAAVLMLAGSSGALQRSMHKNLRPELRQNQRRWHIPLSGSGMIRKRMKDPLLYSLTTDRSPEFRS